MVAVGVSCGFVMIVGDAHPIHVRALHGFRYAEAYLAIFAAALAFPAITIAISIWKQSSSEARLIAQAASLRDYYLNLAERLEGDSKIETSGTISLKGIGETFNDAVFSLQIDQPRLMTWTQSLIREPEMSAVWPSALISVQSIMIPFRQAAIWRLAIASAINFAIFAAVTNLTLAIVGTKAENVYGIVVAIATLCIALRATVRFVLGEQVAKEAK